MKTEVHKITLRQAVCMAFDIPEQSLFEHSKRWDVVDGRKCYIYLFSEILGNGPSVTGRHVFKTHAAIINAVKKFTYHYALEVNFREKANKVINAYEQGRLIVPKPGSKVTI